MIFTISTDFFLCYDEAKQDDAFTVQQQYRKEINKSSFIYITFFF